MAALGRCGRIASGGADPAVGERYWQVQRYDPAPDNAAEMGMYLVDSDGSNLVGLRGLPADDGLWSPDGRWIAHNAPGPAARAGGGGRGPGPGGVQPSPRPVRLAGQPAGLSPPHAGQPRPDVAPQNATRADPDGRRATVGSSRTGGPGDARRHRRAALPPESGGGASVLARPVRGGDRRHPRVSGGNGEVARGAGPGPAARRSVPPWAAPSRKYGSSRSEAIKPFSSRGTSPGTKRPACK